MKFALAFAGLAFAASAVTTFLSLWRRGKTVLTTLRQLKLPASGEPTESVVVAKEVGYQTRSGRCFSVVSVRTTAPVAIWTHPRDWSRGQVEIIEAGVHRIVRQRRLRLVADDFVFQSSMLWSTFDPRPWLQRLSVACFASAVVSLLGVAVVALLVMQGLTEIAAIWALTQFLVMPVVENKLTEHARCPDEGGRTFVETT